jgi:hypothetical protein
LAKEEARSLFTGLLPQQHADGATMHRPFNVEAIPVFSEAARQLP